MAPPTEKECAAARALLFERSKYEMDKVFGDKSYERVTNGMNEFNQPVMEYMFRNVWDGIWSGDGIEPKYRSLIHMSILGATGKISQLKIHVKGGLSNGLTEGEIRESMLHVMGYCGFSTGLDALGAANEVVAAWKEEQAQK